MIQHEKEFYLTINGQKYKAIYGGFAWTYATLTVWKEVKYTIRKFLLFGEKLEKTRWSKIVDGYSNEYQENQSIKRRTFYEEASTKENIKELLDLYDKENNTVHNPFLN